MPALVGILTKGTHAAKPAAAAPNAGQFYLETDVGGGTLFQSDGSAWTQLAAGVSAAAGAVFATLLDYAAATDIAVSASLPANTWTDLGTNQSFTVTSGAAAILIAVSGNVTVGGGSPNRIGMRINVDSAGTPVLKMAGGAYVNSSGFANALAGTNLIVVSGLSAAAHTVKVQLYSDTNSQNFWCRASTHPNEESLQIRVFQMG